jgi:Zn-dependent protease/CBS domain-containing protein
VIGKRIELFRVFGIPLRIDLSWFIIVLLVTWSLSKGFFPTVVTGLSPRAYWVMGALGALGLFLSVILHELSHALVARTYGLSISGITLFIFGGVAEMESEPPSARAEFMVAIAGPIASVLIALACSLMIRVPWSFQGAAVLVGVLTYLTFINRMLVLFNLIPAFPLDGGRVLRSALWQWKNDLPWATSITSRLGSGFGIALIALGVLLIILGRGQFSGIWYILIGMFLRNAARMSYRQLLMRSALEGEAVSRFMRTDPLVAPRSLSVAELVNHYFNRYPIQTVPVVDGSTLIGCVAVSRVQELSPEEWERTTVGAITTPCPPQSIVAPNSDAMGALVRMSRLQSSHLMVVEEGRLVGVVALQDLLRFLSSTQQLGFSAAP